LLDLGPRAPRRRRLVRLRQGALDRGREHRQLQRHVQEPCPDLRALARVLVLGGTMKAHKNRLLVLIAGAALAAGVVATRSGRDGAVLAQAPAMKTYNFNAYFAIGDSLAAGYESGSLVETHQVNSVPALIARQAQVADFQQPLISEPGI